MKTLDFRVDALYLINRPVHEPTAKCKSKARLQIFQIGWLFQVWCSTMLRSSGVTDGGKGGELPPLAS